MVQTGNIQPGYIDNMLGREKVANIFLGNGIAIPHGLPEDRELINRTGLGREILERIAWLKRLLNAYRSGLIHEG